MVLSLAFVLAFIGAAVGLLVGILIFGEVSDAIQCPASGGGGGGVLFNTLSETSDGTVDLDGSPNRVGQLLGTNGEQITSVTINNMQQGSLDAQVVSEIWTGATTDIDSSTLVATSDNTLDTTGLNLPFNYTWTFTPAVTVNNPNTFVAIHIENWDSNFDIPTSTIDVGLGVIKGHNPITTSGFYDPPNSVVDLLMKVEIVGGGGAGEVGSEQCEQAKDTAWTVIGIMPVALFFGLFALFSSFGKPT